ncbi:MAG: hypothetical protein U7123_09025 [Potamolinea sp.]
MTAVIQSSQNFWDKIAGYCQKNYQFLTKNPRLFLMRKLARFEGIRDWILFFFKRPIKSYEISKDNPSLFQDINVDKVISGLETDSFALGINLPQDVVQEILNFAHSKPCYGNREHNFGFYYRDKEQTEARTGKQIRLGSYFGADDCQTIKKLETDPGLLAISAKFLGATPVHIATELWWSFPASGTAIEQLKAAQVFHYDMDDYRFIKFFFYLTDVDSSSGPHVTIRGTHKNKKLSHQLLGVRCASKDDNEIIDSYGAQNVVTICGPAGFGFAEDTYCFHKGAVPTEKERLLLQIEFAINDYGNLRDF